MDALIRQAIAEKKLLKFDYQDYPRIAEPHVYGRNGGVRQLLVYQVRGGSKSGKLPSWRRVDLRGVFDLLILDETFAGRRDNPSGDHSSWDETFVIVS